MTVYKLKKGFSASADSAASLDIQFDGVLTAVWWSVKGDFDADGEKFDGEVSFLSSNTIAATDSRGSISSVSAQAAGTPSPTFGINSGISGLKIGVAQGERIHLHGILTTTADVECSVYLYVEDRGDPRLRRRR